MAAYSDKSKTFKALSSRAFFATHPVFTQAEFVRARVNRGGSARTANNLLVRYVESGRLLRVRRGLYATVPEGADASRFTPDPYLVASRLRSDAVVAYHTALAFHGKAHSVWQRAQYVTASRPKPFTFRGVKFVGVQAPLAVRRLPDLGGEVLRRPHAGGEVRVTSLERCLVDVLHAPAHGGGWEEVWRCFEMVEFLDLQAVIRHALRLRSALTVARVGFFLEQHREEWMVEDRHLKTLARHAPRQPRYLDTRRQPGRLVARWNLVVPQTVLDRRWEELRDAGTPQA